MENNKPLLKRGNRYVDDEKSSSHHDQLKFFFFFSTDEATFLMKHLLRLESVQAVFDPLKASARHGYVTPTPYLYVHIVEYKY